MGRPQLCRVCMRIMQWKGHGTNSNPLIVRPLMPLAVRCWLNTRQAITEEEMLGPMITNNDSDLEHRRLVAIICMFY